MAKAFIPVLAVVSFLAVPTCAFARGNGPLTREQVHAELIRLQQAGYDHTNGDTHNPANIQAALKSVAAQQQAFSGYGGVNSGSAASGAPAQLASDNSIFRGG